jgi:type 1 glutamine amidotransferase
VGASRLCVWALLIPISVLGCRSNSPPSPTMAEHVPLSPPKRLLVVTHTTGFRHSSIETAETTLKSLGDTSGIFTTTFCRTATDVEQMLASGALANIDGVFFANTTGDLEIPDLGAFLSWIRAGHPFLGAHSASDTYHSAPDYIDMLGAEFATHGNQTTVELTIEDRTDPATAMLPSPFRIFDEIYEFRSNPRDRSHVLLSLPRHPDDGHPDAGKPGDFPIAWNRSYGAGRVFYTALGHREDVWTNTSFQQHLLGAIRWAFQLT